MNTGSVKMVVGVVLMAGAGIIAVNNTPGNAQHNRKARTAYLENAGDDVGGAPINTSGKNGLPPSPSPSPGASPGASPGSTPPPGGTGNFNSNTALEGLDSDSAEASYCARGVANILAEQGLPYTPGNATDWDTSLTANGWTYLPGVSPTEAPEGAVLVYNNNAEAGLGTYSGGGGREFGHVEVVTYNSAGQRLYASDTARTNYGGTVPGNYAGAWVYNP